MLNGSSFHSQVELHVKLSPHSQVKHNKYSLYNLVKSRSYKIDHVVYIAVKRNVISIF